MSEQETHGLNFRSGMLQGWSVRARRHSSSLVLLRENRADSGILPAAQEQDVLPGRIH